MNFRAAKLTLLNAFLKGLARRFGARSLSAEASIAQASWLGPRLAPAQAVPIGLWPLGLRLDAGQLFTCAPRTFAPQLFALGLGTEFPRSLAPAKPFRNAFNRVASVWLL